MKKKLLFLAIMLSIGILYSCTAQLTFSTTSNTENPPITSNSTSNTTTSNSTNSTSNTTTSNSTNSTSNTTTGDIEELAKLKAAVIELLNAEFNKFDVKNYTAENYQKIVLIKNQATQVINQMNHVEDVKNYDLQKIVDEMKKISMTTGDLPWV